MDAGLQIVGVGALLVTSLLLRNAAAGHVTPDMVPECLMGRLRFRNQCTHLLLALATGVVMVGVVLLLASQIATEV